MPRRSWLAGIAPVVITVGLAILGTSGRPDPSGSLDVAVAQGGLPTWVYARAEADPAWRDVPLRAYRQLTLDAPGADLVIWPETAVWRIWGEDAEYERLLGELQREHGGALLVGLPRRDAAGSYVNAAVLLSPDREPAFGEKRRLALLAEVSFGPGHRVPILSVGGARVGVIFCLESVAPQYAREVALAGAELIVVLAEGSRFGETPVSDVHARRSIVRAVETGRAVVHAGQHGGTTIISPRGVYGPPLPPYGAGVVREQVPLVVAPTPYVAFGPWILIPAAIFLLIALAGRGRRLLRRSGSR